MEILLVAAPNVNVIEPFRSSPKVSNFIKFIQSFPIGLGYLAAVLEREGFKVNILDAQLRDLTIESVLKYIKDFNPDIVGITTLTANIKVTVKIASLIKKRNDNIKIVLGGPHATYDYNNLLKNYPIDYVVVGEGEYTLLDLVRTLDKKGNLSNINGLAYRQNDKIIVSPARQPNMQLDDLPYPARHLVDFNAYFDYFTPDLRDVVQIMGSRGCPYKCAFCSSGHTYRKWRSRSAQNIVDEILYLEQAYTRMKSFSFMDDNFTFNRSHVVEICNLLIERGLNRYAWDCLARVDQVDEGLLYLMKKAGCCRIQYGIESASSEILKNIGKKIDIKTTEKAIAMAKDNGIEAYAFFMIGNPGETEDSINLSVKTAFKFKPTYVNWFVTQIYPGTMLAELQPVDNWVEYIYEPEIRNPSLYTHPCIPTFNPDGFNREILKKRVAKIMQQFFWCYLPRNFFRWLKKLIRYPRYSLWYLKHLLGF